MTVNSSVRMVASVALASAVAASQAAPASFAGDVDFTADLIYQIVTDRFVDGDPSNNPPPERFSASCAATELFCGGDWKGIEARIRDGYLGGMGVSAIMVSVPVENIDALLPPSISAFHGYWLRDLKRSNRAFGTLADFRSLVATAHAHGIKVMIDFANNQTSPVRADDPGYGENGVLTDAGRPLVSFSSDPHGMYHRFGPVGMATQEQRLYGAIWEMADINQQHPAMDAYLKSAIRFWLDLGIDAIRADSVKHIPLAWQRTWVEAINSHRPVFLVGEWFVGRGERDPEAFAFANRSGMGVLDFPFAQAVRAVLHYRERDMRHLDQVVAEGAAGYARPLEQVTFIDNHDQNRFTLSDAPEHRRITEQGIALALTSRGTPMLYYGTEQYMHGKGHSPHNRARMSRFDTSTPAYRLSASLAALRKTNPALRFGSQETRWVSADAWVFERRFHGHTVLVAINRDQQRPAAIGALATALPCAAHQDVLKGAFGGAAIEVDCAKGAAAPFTLAPGAIALWSFYDSAPGGPQLGHAGPALLLPGHQLTLSGRQFGARRGTVTFDGVAVKSAAITAWSDTRVTLRVPRLPAGRYRVALANARGQSQSYGPLELLAGPQLSLRLVVDGAAAAKGESVYAVGAHGPLASDPAQAEHGPMFNQLVHQYPSWYLDLAVPGGRTLSWRFIKKDAAGRVNARERGPAHVFKGGRSGVATARVRLNGWSTLPQPENPANRSTP